MRAAIVAVGSELLGTHRLDTNSLLLARSLRAHGVDLVRKSVVGDDEKELAHELRSLIGCLDLVLVTGGLGPTADDVTRQAVALACGRRLVEDPAVVADIEAKFRSFGRRMPAVNRRQALVPVGAEVVANPRGTAPALRLEQDATVLLLLPGVPRELAGLVETVLDPWLLDRAGDAGIGSTVVRIAGLPESEVEERLGPAYSELGREAITVLSGAGEVRVELQAAGTAAEREPVLAEMARRVAELVGPAAFAIDEDVDLETVVGRLLAEAGATVATAESCTGGLVAERLTRVPGSSRYVIGGLVAYADLAKQTLAGVDAATLAAYGAVSEQVALELAAGARAALGADFGIGITGIAGPGGGTADKPVGRVHLAVAGPGGDTSHRRADFPGDRERVRQQAAQLALDMLRRRLLAEVGEETSVG